MLVKESRFWNSGRFEIDFVGFLGLRKVAILFVLVKESRVWDSALL